MVIVIKKKRVGGYVEYLFNPCFSLDRSLKYETLLMNENHRLKSQKKIKILKIKILMLLFPDDGSHYLRSFHINVYEDHRIGRDTATYNLANKSVVHGLHLLGTC